MKHIQVKRLTYVASAGTLGAVVLMSLSLLFPGPLLLVVAMSVGQALGTLSLALFLLAILGLEGSRRGEQAAQHDQNGDHEHRRFLHSHRSF